MSFLKGRNRLWKIGWRNTVLCVKEPRGARLLKIRQELFLRQRTATARVFFPADQVEQTPTASSEMRSVVSDVSVLSFVSDATVPQLTLASNADFNQVEEYESDSDDSDNDVDIESEELVIGKPIMTRSGRQVKVWTRFDV